MCKEVCNEIGQNMDEYGFPNADLQATYVC